ncbi:DNA polymerase delta small subunit [Penicillium rolfsii]|nr:DNA polymerase delta small subunit [Penicillium rolfsii]
MASAEDYGFLRPPSNDEYEPVYRKPSSYNPLQTYTLPMGSVRHYQQQYGDMYFLRLAKLKPVVEKVATDAWGELTVAGESARRVDRVLDVRQGELCWMAGTVYMDMPLKPNILDDLTRETFTSAPPPRRSYTDPSNPSATQIMMEDESGRIRLTGNLLASTQLATGVIIAALGTETVNGEFEVIDIKVPDLAPQPQRWERGEATAADPSQSAQDVSKGTGKIAFVSGLGITGTSSDTLALELLTDYLLGYTGIDSDADASRITRLIIAGNSLGASVTADAASAGSDNAAKKKLAPKKYGYDASAYNSSPITQLDNFLAEILPSIPVTLMAGEKDPANVSLPQQGIHRAMFPKSRAYCAPPPSGENKEEVGWFDSVSNPWEGDVEGWRLWGCSGQNVDDVLRYLDFPSDDADCTIERDDSEARLRIMEAMLRWRCGVPTAPDTLWSYPFQTVDPFVLETSPHIFFTGNQPSFKTAVIEAHAPFQLDGDVEMTDSSRDTSTGRVRLLSIPKFKETGELILVDTESLEVEVVRFALSTSKVLLVPYSTWHVPRYHEWMQDEEIQEATASEPLTIEEEYAMQRSWRQDADKLTFIVCRPVTSSEEKSAQLSNESDSSQYMVGDINLFLRVDDGEEGDAPPEIVGEIELMIAEKVNQGRGIGKAALLTFLRYIVERQAAIIEEFVNADVQAETSRKLRAAQASLQFSCLSVKIGQANSRSLALFESLGFVKVSVEPNYFGEFELRRVDLDIGSINEALVVAGVNNYQEIPYTRKE